jgi:hypothetical protein
MFSRVVLTVIVSGYLDAYIFPTLHIDIIINYHHYNVEQTKLLVDSL